ncbi:MAG: amino acid adenylation domain-containing protein, partial [bacterium]|nr:amino acid adenylation domain-containing protein [bacterium]
EKKLVEIWSDLLIIGKVGIDDNFFQLGGHSLKAVMMISRMHKVLNLKMSLTDIFLRPTIREIADLLKGKKGETGDTYLAIEPVEKLDYYPLSSAQKRLYLLYQLDTGSTAYNVPETMRLEGPLHKEKLEKTFTRLIRRQESFRTSFHMEAGEPVQRVHEQVEFEIDDYEGLRGGAFDLSKAPLLRVGLREIAAQVHLLMVEMHHIISDGFSIGVLIRDFMALYNGDELAPLRVRYKDFARWQSRFFASAALKRQEEWWLRQFAGEIPVLELPTDYNRPVMQSMEGNSVTFEVGAGETAALNALALRQESTLFMVLAAVYSVLLARLGSREDVVIGTPIAGRRHADLEDIIGMFVNTLALRSQPGGHKTFETFLQEFRDRTLQAFENQDYQFEDLVERVSVKRDTSRNPLFDVLFALQNTDLPEIRVPGLTLKPHPVENRISKFDLVLNGVESGGCLIFRLGYAVKLFMEETVQRFTRYFKNILSAVIQNPGTGISSIEILSEEEKHHLLIEVNRSDRDFPAHKTLHQLFEEQANKTPDHTALAHIIHRSYMTYSQLNRKAGHLANRLSAQGVAPGDIVAIKAERTADVIIGLLGILKAGAAYLPIDPDFPRERIDYMLKDSNAKILLRSEDVGNRLACSSPPDPAPGNEYLATGLAYILYTSGTTGRPKGVMVEHRSAVNIVTWYAASYRIRPGTHQLLMPELTFDPSVNQVFGTLLHGASLYLIRKELLFDIEGLRSYIDKYRVDVIYTVPQLLNELLVSGPLLKSVRLVISGGERLDNAFKDAVMGKGYVLYNQYGPTETTVDVLMEKCSKRDVTLGTPTFNARCYIFDRYRNLVPVGVVGELYIGGVGVTRGYLNRPELTADKFNRSYKSYRTYRTGDLCRRLPDGNIQFLGRMDHQVKIRGFRIELGEIENRLLSHDRVTDAAVVDKQYPSGEKYLCAYIVSQTVEAGELKEFLGALLPAYMVPAYFLNLERLPLNPNGKVDRKQLPDPTMDQGEQYATPRDEIEKKLARIWEQLLEGEIGIDDDFFERGGHSLKGARMAAVISKELNVNLPLAELFKTPTIRGLAVYIRDTAGIKYTPSVPLEAVEKREYYPLSSAQRRLYLLQKGDKESTAYNMPRAVLLEGDLDKERMENTFSALIERHESFRTSFETVKGEPVQKIHTHAEFKIGLGEAPSLPLISQFVHPFDLSRPPLLRVELRKIEEQKHFMVLDMHHVISDGASSGIFYREFMALYGGEHLPAPQLRYTDFAVWRNRADQLAAVAEQEAYWLGEFAGDIPVLDLPYDFPRPARRNFAGNTCFFEIGEEETLALNRLAREEGVTLFMVLLAVFTVLLSKLSSREDIVVGTPVLGRRHADLQGIIGMFVNT